MNKLIKPIKKALAKKYGYKNVSVKNGKGTAWGWVEASIKIDEPKDRDEAYRIRKEAEEIARETLKKEGLKFYTYCSDDGYGSDRECFLLDLNY